MAVMMPGEVCSYRKYMQAVRVRLDKPEIIQTHQWQTHRFGLSGSLSLSHTHTPVHLATDHIGGT